MKKLFSIAITATLILSGAGRASAEPESYELMGFPITPHQASTLGSAGIKEQPPAPMLTLDGMPASPHQNRSSDSTAQADRGGQPLTTTLGDHAAARGTTMKYAAPLSEGAALGEDYILRRRQISFTDDGLPHWCGRLGRERRGGAERPLTQASE